MKKLGFFALLLIITACQPGEAGSDTSSNGEEESQNTAPIEEKPTLAFQTEGTEIQAETVRECWVENCQEENSMPEGSLSLVEKTEAIPGTTVRSGDTVHVEIDGEKPDRLSYQMQEGGDMVSQNLEEQSIEVYGEGEQHFLLTAKWHTDEGSFQGSKTIGFVLNVEKEEDHEVKEQTLKETRFTFDGDAYTAVYHVNCLNETACEAPPTNTIESYEEWKEEVDPANIDASIGNEIKIDFPDHFKAPDRLSYEKQQGATGRQEGIEDHTIEVMGEEGKEIIYIVWAEWTEAEKTIAAVQFAFIVPNP